MRDEAWTKVNDRTVRSAILARIPAPQGDDPPDSTLNWTVRSPEELRASFQRELQALGARVFCADSVDTAKNHIEEVVMEKGGEAVVAGRPVVESLHLAGPHFRLQGAFPAANAMVSVTQADYGLADTGTLVLFSTQGEGRTLSLLAPVNIVVISAARIVAHLPELFARVPDPASVSSAMIFVTGPSRTADIELTLTVGVHGPGELHVVILE